MSARITREDDMSYASLMVHIDVDSELSGRVGIAYPKKVLRIKLRI